MRLLASLFLMIAMSFNTPSICAHALGMDELQAASQEVVQDMADHAHMKHEMPQMEHEMPDGHSNHCPDGCDGGKDCQGCNAISSLIFSNDDLSFRAFPDTRKTWAKRHLTQASMLLDPPPPKFLS